MILLIDAIKIFVPVITSLVVCYVTLYFTNKRNSAAMTQQQQNYTESLLLSEKKYLEQYAINEENERLKHLPYLSLIPKYENNRFEGRFEYTKDTISLPFKIVNEGLGIAFSIQLKYLNDESKPDGVKYPAVSFDHSHDDVYNILGVSSPIDTDVLRVEKDVEFYLHLSACDKKSNKLQPDPDIRWEFFILFCDIQNRKYSQKYSFYTSTLSNKIIRINSFVPQLIK